MSRVVSVIEGRGIMVKVQDVFPGDILYIFGEESDPIIDLVRQERGLVKYYYKESPVSDVNESHWIDPEKSPHVLIHDLKKEGLISNDL